MSDTETLRIQKYIADCGVMSRRAAEAAIAAGRVTVNGRPAEIGQKISPDTDHVVVDGKDVYPYQNEKICIMLNKPRGYVTTASDDRGRRVVTDLVQEAGRRVYPIGRLDMNSEGLLLLTDDGDLTYRLTHPRHEIPKIYQVSVRGAVTKEQLKKLSSPMTLDGYTIQPVQTEVLSLPDPEHKNTVLRMTLYEGRNRQIRKMCDNAGLSVARLCRIAVGQLTLGGLRCGEWRYLTKKEIEYLMGGKD